MSLVKESQSYLEGADVPVIEDTNALDMSPLPAMDSIQELLVEEDGAHEDALSDVMEETPAELSLRLDHVPGGLDQDEIVEEEEEVEEPKAEDPKNPWSWNVKNFLHWLDNMMKNVPAHSGRDVSGLERAIAYLQALDREISKAVRTDLNNEIAIESVEKARDEIRRGIERLEERHEKVQSSKYPKKKKKADDEVDGLVKEAGMRVGGIVISVPLLISSLARSCINSTVSAGKDIEHTFKKLADQYKLNDRERLELSQLIQDLGFTIRTDFGMPVGEAVNTTSTQNVNWPASYFA